MPSRFASSATAVKIRGRFALMTVRSRPRYVYGGVYLDMDIEPQGSFNGVLAACPSALFWEPRVYVLMLVRVHTENTRNRGTKVAAQGSCPRGKRAASVSPIVYIACTVCTPAHTGACRFQMALQLCHHQLAVHRRLPQNYMGNHTHDHAHFFLFWLFRDQTACTMCVRCSGHNQGVTKE